MSALTPDSPQVLAAARRIAALPRVTRSLALAGSTWAIEAVDDQAALSAAADQFDPFPYGLLLWDSAPVLAADLAAQADRIAGRSVLEIGCGVGLVGLMAAHLGARVVQTDHSAEALVLAMANGARNGIGGVSWLLADWQTWQDGPRFDIIAGSDVLYDTCLHGPVARLAARHLAPGGRLLLADPGRTTTPAFLALLERERWRVTRRRQRVPALDPVRPGETVMVTLIEARQEQPSAAARRG